MELLEIPEDKRGTGLMPGAGPHRYSGPRGDGPGRGCTLEIE